MSKNIARILEAATHRPLSTGEHQLITSYIRDLERRKARPDDVLESRIKELEQRLDDCRATLRRYDSNEIMD